MKETSQKELERNNIRQKLKETTSDTGERNNIRHRLKETKPDKTCLRLGPAFFATKKLHR